MRRFLVDDLQVAIGVKSVPVRTYYCAYKANNKEKRKIAREWGLSGAALTAAVNGKVRALADAYYDGDTSKARDLIENLEHTISTESSYGNIKDFGYQKWQWQSVHDDTVDDICSELDGQVFDIDEPFELAHPNCRCFPAPYGDVE